MGLLAAITVLATVIAMLIRHEMVTKLGSWRRVFSTLSIWTWIASCFGVAVQGDKKMCFLVCALAAELVVIATVIVVRASAS